MLAERIFLESAAARTLRPAPTPGAGPHRPATSPSLGDWIDCHGRINLYACTSVASMMTKVRPTIHQ
jgi:hypothetical protein